MIIKKCLICGKEFRTFLSELKIGKGNYCSRKCKGIASRGRISPMKGVKGIFKSNKTSFKKGLIPWNKGKAISESLREKISKSCLSTYNNGKIVWNKGIKYLQISGTKHYRWMGGKIIIKNRYFILSPNHPHKRKNGYITQSRIIAEKYLNRYLTSKEIIHHINGNSLDDRPENLYLFSSTNEHTKYHMSKNRLLLISNILSSKSDCH